MKNRLLLLALAALAAVVLTACGGAEPAGDNDTATANGDGAVAVDVSLQDIEFVPDSVEVPAGSPVTFNVTNDGNLEHDLVFEGGPESGIVAPGDSATVEATFTEDTVGWCDVPGHREAGMELEIIVTD